MPAILAKKLGMTQRFLDDGRVERVTVLEAGPCPVLAVRANDLDGYEAVQLAFGSVREKSLTRAELGHLKKVDAPPVRTLAEFRDEAGELMVGETVTVEAFEVGQVVKVAGKGKGKGFAGTIKRHNFKSQRASHGNSRSHNVPGSISMAQDPGRVFPGKKMSGQLGNVTRTTQNLDIVRIDEARQLLLVRGAVPGSKNGHVVVRPAVKAKALTPAKKGAN